MKPTLATVWLDGCSGCHMSLLDMDERLIDVLARADLVYSPLVDLKVFPETVDVTLVEGAVSSEEDLHKIRHVRARTKLLVALGDCAVTSNVPGMRNPFGVAAVMARAYDETVTGPGRGTTPSEVIPALLPTSRPVHEVVTVDLFLPGCPPPADAIHTLINDLVEGRTPDLSALSRLGR
jgi:NAD-reducing hydrogenase small subunit